jgi:hypothetical protein
MPPIGTQFRSVVAGLGIDTVLMTGVATDRGVLATARDAAYQGIMMVAVTDAVGSFTDGAHEAGLQELGRVAHFCSAALVLAAWGSGLGSPKRTAFNDREYRKRLNLRIFKRRRCRWEL